MRSAPAITVSNIEDGSFWPGCMIHGSLMADISLHNHSASNNDGSSTSVI